MQHLCAIYEIINFLHKIIQKDGLTEAEAQVPGEQTKLLPKKTLNLILYLILVGKALSPEKSAS